MPANPNGFQHFKHGEPLRTLRSPVASGFERWSVGEPPAALVIWRAVIGRSLVLPFTVRVVAGRSLGLPYVLRVPVGRSLVTSYAMVGRVGRSLALVFKIQPFLRRPFTAEMLLRNTDAEMVARLTDVEAILPENTVEPISRNIEIVVP